MRFLPVCLDLRAGPILLLGQGELVRAKLRLLLAAGASIRWYAMDGDRDMAGVAAEDVARIVHEDGDVLTADLAGVIAVLCAGAGEIGHAMAARARRAGLPVNVMDELDHSTFIFPAIVDRGDVVVAIGTGGTSPVVARRVREIVEAALPARIGDLASLIGRWRKPIADHIKQMPLRRRFWEKIVDGPIGAAVLAGRSGDAEAALRAIADPQHYAGADATGVAAGHVTLVGAGPGDPDLLTIKALRALQDADVVFYDELVTREILDRVRRDAARVPVGRRVGKPGIGQDNINVKLVAAAQAGQRVVRLKGGDAFIFGRGGEEVDALRAAGVSVSIIPGITAGLGAAAQFEVPLTFRREALRITFLTAHKVADAETVDWRALTDVGMTVVVYMGMTAAPAIRDGLLAAGRPASTPVGVFARVTRPDAQAQVGRLDELPELVARISGGPAILIIGDVVAHSAPWSSKIRQAAQLAQAAHETLVAAE